MPAKPGGSYVMEQIYSTRSLLTSKLSYKALSCSVTVFVLDFHLSFLLNMFED